MRRFAGLGLLLAGCLPAYDNGTASISDMSIDVGDLAGADLSGDMIPAGCMVPSGSKRVTGAIFSLEDQAKVPGPIVHIDGYPQPEWASGPPVTPFTPNLPADINGKFALNIPQCADDGMKHYLVLDGMLNGKAMLRTWIAPAVVMSGTGVSNQNVVLHPFLNDSMMGIRATIESDLKKGGKIPMNKSLGTDYGFMFGWLADIGVGSASGTVGAIAQITVPGGDGGMVTLDNTNCMPDQQCCIFYTDDYDDFLANPVPNFLELTTQSASYSGWLTIICPASETGDITLTQTEPNLMNMHDFKSSNKPKKPFPVINVPRVPSDAVFIDWGNQ